MTVELFGGKGWGSSISETVNTQHTGRKFCALLKHHNPSWRRSAGGYRSIGLMMHAGVNCREFSEVVMPAWDGACHSVFHTD